MSVNKSVKPKDQSENTPIAIIGMGCLFPKAGSRQSFWRILRTGEDCIGPVPETHWSVNDLYDGDHASPDRCYAKMGGFLEPYPFDPTEFNIPPNVLEATDTSQLLGLVGAKAALEDAGYGENGKELPKDRTGVILGVTGALEMVIPLGARLGHPRWRKALAQAGIDKETSEKIIADIADSYVSWQENSFPGLLGNVVAGRIANRLDLHGTNCAVDAACASSLAAVHLAVSELQAGQADVCLSGGTDTFNDIFMFTCFSKTPALSDSGQISPFSESCDGTLLGEGIGVLVLKRLADAERDHDRIYAVIKGMGTSSDGNSGAIYAPSAPGQAMALRRAYQESGVDPKTVEAVEAHGTGTKVGDAVEFKALKEVYQEAGAALQSCALGTVKSQIGHTKASAGAASLCKAAFSLFHKVILPTLHVSKPNPKLEIEDSPFYLNTSVRPWLSNPQHPRRIGVSSFGFGGSNFHAVLEEHNPERLEPAWDGSVQIWPFSAADKPALIASVRSAAACKAYESAYQACLQRENFDPKAPCRAAIVTGPADYAEKLAALAEALENGKEQSGGLPEGAFYGDAASDPGKTAFLFPGQGSQYVRMGSELFTIFPEALQTLECAQQTLKGSGQAPAEYIFPKPRFTENEEDENTKALTDTRITQPSLGAVESAMAAVLERFGVTPQAMAGHSYGELVALQHANVFTQKDLFSLSALRGALMAAGDGGRGTMSAVSAPLADIESVVREIGDGLVLANRNHPTQGVISGPKEAVAKAEELCKSRKMTVKRLQVSAAFHSSLLQSARDPFFSALQQTEFKTPQIPVYADMTGKPYRGEAQADRLTLADQLLNSVHFIEIIENMYADGVRTFIEVGPKTVLTGLVKKILGKQPCHLLSTDGRRGGGELKNIALTLAQLAVLGYPVKLSAWEEKVSKPRHKRMEVPICGANYRTPGKKAPAPWSDPKQPADNYQPIKFVSDNPPVLPAPTPIEKLEIVEPVSQNQAAEYAPAQPPVLRSAPAEAASYSPVKDNPVSQTDLNTPSPAAVPAASAEAAAAGGSSVMLEAFRTIQSGLSAMQALQQQTAAAHMRFLESQEEIQRSLQSIITAQQGLAQFSLQPGALRSLPVMPAAVPAPAAVINKLTSVPRPAPSAAAPAPVQTSPIIPAVSPMAGYSANEPLPVPISSPKSENRESGNQNLNLPKAPLANAEPDAAVAVLSVVSEMTGYPADMLRLDMNLETDLGIDSIKRVEILSAIQRSLPRAKTIAPDEIGSLQTLQQIIERLGVSPTPAAPQPKPAPAAPAAPASPRQNNGPAPQPQGSGEAIVMKVVTETTGYPEEAVSLDMDLENDLGVDSIKRVEILAAIQKALPEAAQIAPDELNSLHTLRQILNKLVPQNAAPQPSVPAEAPAARADKPASVTETIISVIAEMTGYPVETLNPDMDLENDLGIDSIKRVEILAAIQKALPDVKDISPSELSGLHTIKDIIARLSGEPHDPQGGPSPSDPDSDKKKDHNPAIDRKSSGPDPHSAAALGGAWSGSEPPLLRRRLRYLPSPRPSQSAAAADAGPYFIFGDKELGAALRLALQRSGKKAELITAGQAAKLVLPPKFSLIAVMGHRRIETEDDVYTSYSSADGELKELFRITRSLCQLCNKAKIYPQRFITITNIDGAFGTLRADFQPIEAGLHGLTRVMANEYPQSVCRAFDVDSNLNPGQAAALITEELEVKGSCEVGLSAETRRIAVLQEDKLNLAAPNPALPPRPVIIVTGGARGVTADCLKKLAQARRCRFILIGRSPIPRQEDAKTAKAAPRELKPLLYSLAKGRGEILTPKQLEDKCRQILANREVLQNIAALEKEGSEVLYLSADVGDYEQVCQAAALAKERFGPIDGFIHGAGVLADRYIADKTDEQFNRVFDTKIRGLYNLSRALKDEPLKFALTFSSVSARFGRPGQCDYAMANEVMNKFTHFASFYHPQTRFTAMGWGPWEGGMVDAALKRVFEELGVEVIARPKGARALAEEVLFGAAKEAELIMGEGFDVPSEYPAQASEAEARHEDFRRTLNLENYSFLKDHVINGRPVMPIALMVELAAQACRKYFPEYKFLGCDKLRILQPIALPAGKKPAADKLTEDSELYITADKVLKEGDLLRAELTFRHAEGLESKRCVICTALLGKTRPDRSQIKLPQTQTEPASESVPQNIEEIYKNYLFHGPSLKGIRNIEKHNPKTVVVNVKSRGGLPLSKPDGEALTDPLFLDCALQTGLIFSGLEQGSCSLPMYCGKYRQYVDKFPENAKIALIADGCDPQQLRGDVYIEHDGDILAHLGDVHWTLSPHLAEHFRKNRL